ncbi:hypothetical protein MBLNU457_g0008t1 [Dothideomycetes sp. NU457]
MDRHRWTQDRRRKQPSLYDEYLNEERSSQKSTSTDRTVTPEFGTSSVSTIRAVTPDSVSENTSVLPQSTRKTDRDLSGLSSSPSASSRSARKQRVSPNIGSSKGNMARSEFAAENKRASTMGLMGHNSGRPRTRTLQESSGEEKDRRKSAVLHKKAYRTSSVSHAESPSTSSSFPKGKKLPSSISQPLFPSQPMPLASRPTMHIPRPDSAASTSASSVVSGPLPSPNTRRILHLMKTLCGRMSGNVVFRKSSRDEWLPVYCYIKEDVGSLMSESPMDGVHKTLVPDLRGCNVRCLMEDATQTPYLEIASPITNREVQLRVSSQSDMDAWFAALLCWQPIQPKGLQNRKAKSQSAHLSARGTNPDSRKPSETHTAKEAPVIKVGRMIFWDTDISFPTTSAPRTTSGRPAFHRMHSSRERIYGSRWWRRVSSTLRENGELKLFTEADNNLVSVVQLSQLSRSAIQRLDCSLLESDFCMAIYPQYTANINSTGAVRPIYLSFESRVLYEVWFVLLRAFTIPQLYGPSPPVKEEKEGEDDESYQQLLARARTDMFRMERTLSLKIIEAKIAEDSTKNSPNPSAPGPESSPRLDASSGLYVEVHLDGEPRSKTSIKQGSSPFWAQDFEFLDLPAVLTSASVVLKNHPQDPASVRHDLRLVTEAYGLVGTPQDSGASSGYAGISHDQTLGKVEIVLEELEPRKDMEQRWPVLDNYGQRIGEILIRARAEENVILMRQEYEPLARLLADFTSGLTIQIALAIPTELRRLSECLLNIFQVQGLVADWLMALVEDEIDGLSKETPLSRIRYAQIGSGDDENQRDRVVRDAGKNAALEANLLFRGNTLLTKALDIHMRRVGSDYLTLAVGGVILKINERDPECEVDTNRVTNEHELRRNWYRLTQTAEEVWKAISSTAQKCPVELRLIFRHIKACAEDRYGDFLRSVSYSSVSGFLFLRFFLPAILNPSLFGLLKEEPKPRAKRTLTLVAKSLMTMANMATFGTKESWMEPMNSFLTQHRESFKKFIEDICFVPQSVSSLAVIPPSYSTPNAIKNRLPITSKEGFPSLPYLIDDSREYANLVDLWLHASSSGKAAASEEDPEGPLHKFHDHCTLLHARTQECLSRAERAEGPTSELDFRWEELIESLQGTTGLGTSTPEDTATSTPSETEGDDDEPLDDLPTPIAQTMSALERTASDVPARNANQTDWSNDDDASTAAAILSQDRDPRAGFILPSSSSRHTLRASTIYNPLDITPPSPPSSHSEPSAEDPRPMPLQHVSSGSASALRGFDDSRPSSALSGISARSGMSTDNDVETALPSLSREQARRERVAAREERERKERDSQRFKDVFGGLVGKRGRREKERERERERD